MCWRCISGLRLLRTASMMEVGPVSWIEIGTITLHEYHNRVTPQRSGRITSPPPPWAAVGPIPTQRAASLNGSRSCGAETCCNRLILRCSRHAPCNHKSSARQDVTRRTRRTTEATEKKSWRVRHPAFSVSSVDPPRSLCHTLSFSAVRGPPTVPRVFRIFCRRCRFVRSIDVFRT